MVRSHTQSGYNLATGEPSQQEVLDDLIAVPEEGCDLLRCAVFPDVLAFRQADPLRLRLLPATLFLFGPVLELPGRRRLLCCPFPFPSSLSRANRRKVLLEVEREVLHQPGVRLVDRVVAVRVLSKKAEGNEGVEKPRKDSDGPVKSVPLWDLLHDLEVPCTSQDLRRVGILPQELAESIRSLSLSRTVASPG